MVFDFYENTPKMFQNRILMVYFWIEKLRIKLYDYTVTSRCACLWFMLKLLFYLPAIIIVGEFLL